MLTTVGFYSSLVGILVAVFGIEVVLNLKSLSRYKSVSVLLTRVNPCVCALEIITKVAGKKTEYIGCGFGVGLSWGTVHFTTDNPVISKLVEL